ncbi:MAG TPA: hypothetical protein VIK20_07770 [Bacteroidales bacterium]
MKLRKTILLSILISLTCSSTYSQNKNFDFFGSYNYGLGNLTAKVNASLKYPLVDEVQKLKSGTIYQFEFGAFYHEFGLGFIHNSYVTSASTNYENADLNADTYFENGIISDKLYLSFNGLELLYQIPLPNQKFDVTWKIGLGFQSYSINKDFNLLGTYPSHFNYSVTGNILTTMAGVEINYQLWKMIGIGLETSILPGNYTKLKNAEFPSSIYNDNVTRLSTGLKIKITI